MGGLRRTLAKLPITLPGWHREEQVLRVPLFQRYRERADVPFANFRAILQVWLTASTAPLLPFANFGAILQVRLPASATTLLPFANFGANVQVWLTASAATLLLSSLRVLRLASQPFSALQDVPACLCTGSLHVPSLFQQAPSQEGDQQAMRDLDVCACSPGRKGSCRACTPRTCILTSILACCAACCSG